MLWEKRNRYYLNRFCVSKYFFMAFAKVRRCKACLCLEEFPQEKIMFKFTIQTEIKCFMYLVVPIILGQDKSKKI